MNVYQAFFSLKDGVKDLEFWAALKEFMSYLQGKGDLAKWRLLRRKLGLGPKEFHQLE
jgi:hypothetical protein